MAVEELSFSVLLALVAISNGMLFHSVLLISFLVHLSITMFLHSWFTISIQPKKPKATEFTVSPVFVKPVGLSLKIQKTN